MRRFVADNKLNFQKAANDGRVEKIALTQSDVLQLRDFRTLGDLLQALEETRGAACNLGKSHYVILQIEPV